MSNIKLVVSSPPAIGKTTLLSTLKDTLVISRDGKAFPFEMPHVNVPDYESAQELIDIFYATAEKYEEKMGKMPKTIAIDSISKILLDIEGYCLQKVKSFPYGVVNTEIKQFVDFIERELTSSFNVIMLSHSIYSEEQGGYVLVNAGGSYGKKGGILSEVNEAVGLGLKGKKRVIYYRDPKMIGRTLQKDLPDSVPAEEFSLQDHIELLQSKQNNAAKWSL